MQRDLQRLEGFGDLCLRVGWQVLRDTPGPDVTRAELLGMLAMAAAG